MILYFITLSKRKLYKWDFTSIPIQQCANVCDINDDYIFYSIVNHTRTYTQTHIHKHVWLFAFFKLLFLNFLFIKLLFYISITISAETFNFLILKCDYDQFI